MKPRPLGLNATLDGLDAFESEGPQPAAPASRPSLHASPPARAATAAPVHETGWRWKRPLVWLGVLLVAITISVVAWRPAWNEFQRISHPVLDPGRVKLETHPAGVEVLIDGQDRGVTPVVVPLTPGQHDVVLRRGTDERAFTVDVTSGTEIIHVTEFALTDAPPAATKLSVVTERPGARVTIDGITRGVSPLAIDDLPAGLHRITVTSLDGSADRAVRTEAGVTTSIVFPSLSKGVAAGTAWLTVAAPFDVTVMERDEVIGTSTTPKILIPAGRHDFDLVNVGLGYRVRKSVMVDVGKTAIVRADQVHAPVSATATPSADVTIDGTPVGMTPLSDVMLPIGTHQVVFHHPDFGDRRIEMTVTLQGPNRVAVDFSKP